MPSRRRQRRFDSVGSSSRKPATVQGSPPASLTAEMTPKISRPWPPHPTMTMASDTAFPCLVFPCLTGLRRAGELGHGRLAWSRDALAAYQGTDGSRQDPRVQCQRAVVDVPDVERELIL